MKPEKKQKWSTTINRLIKFCFHMQSPFNAHVHTNSFQRFLPLSLSFSLPHTNISQLRFGKPAFLHG